MFKFSKINILVTLVLSILIFFFNFKYKKFDDNFFNKKINLGLDLQGGSYLLLEIDNDSCSN